jgi:exosortase
MQGVAKGGQAVRLGADLLLRVGAVAAVALLCVPVLRLLAYVWQNTEFYGHAFLVPLASVLVAWRSRGELAQAFLHGAPPRSGPLLALLAATFTVAAIFGDIVAAAGVGAIASLAATAYGIGGTALLRPLGPALGLLAFTIPPPGFVLNGLLFQLKLLVTEWSGRLLQALGFTIAWSGNEVLVPGHALFVADACSGLTSIVTLLPLSVVIAYLLNRGVWRRVVVIASVVPFAIAANVLRVTITVALVPRIGTAAAEGLLHETFGLATYLVGTVALMALARVLR